MTKMIDKSNSYQLPIRFNVNFQLIFKIGILFFNLCMIGMTYLFLFDKSFVKQGIDSMMIFLLLFLFVFTSFVLIIDIDYIHATILHKQYVEINHEGILIKKLFINILLKWSDIYLVEFYTFKMAEILRITKCKYKDTNKYLMALGKGFGFFYISINRRKYSDISINKFKNTVKYNI